MKFIKTGMFLIVFSISLLSPQIMLGQYQIKTSVIGNGAAVVSGGDQQIIGTVGQPVIGAVSNSLNIHQAGFWYGPAYRTASVDKMSNFLPTVYQLKQNYPNPFNPSTTIEFELPKISDTEIYIYNLLGQKIRMLLAETLNPGQHFVRWDGKNDSGGLVASGIYWCSLKAGEFSATKKLLLEK